MSSECVDALARFFKKKSSSRGIVSKLLQVPVLREVLDTSARARRAANELHRLLYLLKVACDEQRVAHPSRMISCASPQVLEVQRSVVLDLCAIYNYEHYSGAVFQLQARSDCIAVGGCYSKLVCERA